MGRLAVLASGNGSNFEALVLALRATGRHSVAVLVCDRRAAFAFERAARLGIPAVYVKYPGRTREEAEAEIEAALTEAKADAVALAGFMRILSPGFAARWEGRLINVHPSLLPRHPGVRAIERSWESGDEALGVTVHYVDGGMDSGPIILQRSFRRAEAASLEAAEERIHGIEHEWYPKAAISLLDGGRPSDTASGGTEA